MSSAAKWARWESLMKNSLPASNARPYAWLTSIRAREASHFEFHTNDTVILARRAALHCGEAHVLKPYAVAITADGIIVILRNGSAPLTLTLQPDGTLRGSGAVDVAGRVVTGTDANGATYAPRSARCAVGSLIAK